MIDSGSNTSFISKNAAENLGLKGCQTHLTMNLAGGKKKAEISELVNITVMYPCDETIEKHMLVHCKLKRAKTTPNSVSALLGPKLF